MKELYNDGPVRSSWNDECYNHVSEDSTYPINYVCEDSNYPRSYLIQDLSSAQQ